MPAVNRQLCEWSGTLEGLIDDLARFHQTLPAVKPSRQAQADLFAEQTPHEALEALLARLNTLHGELRASITQESTSCPTD